MTLELGLVQKRVLSGALSSFGDFGAHCPVGVCMQPQVLCAASSFPLKRWASILHLIWEKWWVGSVYLYL